MLSRQADVQGEVQVEVQVKTPAADFQILELELEGPGAAQQRISLTLRTPSKLRVGWRSRPKIRRLGSRPGGGHPTAGTQGVSWKPKLPLGLFFRMLFAKPNTTSTALLGDRFGIPGDKVPFRTISRATVICDRIAPFIMLAS